VSALLLRVPTTDVHPSLNARGQLGDVAELALSLKVIGQQKPLIVMPRAAGGYELLDGHRRHAAALKAGLPEVDVVVRSDPGEAGRLQAQLAMHTHAKHFDPIAEARALHRLMFDHNLTREQISRAVGRTPAWVRDRIALVHLTAAEQGRVASGMLSIGEALHLLATRRAEREGRPAPRPAAGGNAARPRPVAASCRCCPTHCPGDAS
jgi:ParB family chromosome partitioning protein